MLSLVPGSSGSSASTGAPRCSNQATALWPGQESKRCKRNTTFPEGQLTSFYVVLHRLRDFPALASLLPGPRSSPLHELTTTHTITPPAQLKQRLKERREELLQRCNSSSWLRGHASALSHHSNSQRPCIVRSTWPTGTGWECKNCGD